MKPTYTRLLTPPTGSVVTLSSLKDHLSIYDTSQDVYLESLLSVATDVASNFMGRDILDTHYEDFYPQFSDELELSRNPAVSIISVRYYNDSGVITTVSAGTYFLDDTSGSPRVRLSTDQTYPTDIDADRSNIVIVEYISGLQDDLQSAVGHAILMYCTELWNRRGNSSDRQPRRLPLPAERLLQRYRRVVI